MIQRFSKEVAEALISVVSESTGEYVVVSGSMAPAISRGAKIKVIPYSYGQPLKSGDVVVFNRPDGRKVIHRLIWCKNFVAQTKGDANLYPDKPISIFDITGTVPEMSSRKILIKTYIKSFLKRFRTVMTIHRFIKLLRRVK